MKSSPIPKALLAVAGVVTISMWAFTLLSPSNQNTSPSNTPSPSFSLHTNDKRVAVWFGDSFVEGAGASKPSKSFSYRVSQHFGLFHKNLSEGASGYIGNLEVALKRCGADDCLSLMEILKKQKMLRADVIFVQSGLNDDALTPENSYVVDEFYKELRVTYPTSIIISLSPVKPFTADESLKKIQYLAKKSVTQIGGYYVDLGSPLLGHPEWLSEDDFHPNDLGYKVLADIIIDKTAPILDKLVG